MTAIWCTHAWLDGPAGAPGRVAQNVRIEVDGAGLIASVSTGTGARPGDLILSGVVYPAAANAHSHAFHRILRGCTHASGGGAGDFWTWRDRMYEAAAQLTPRNYERLATAVYAEMVAAGWTSVAEFHYVHHRPDGLPYGHRPGTSDDEPHAMELALARAAVNAGIRLTLLDACYLVGGIGVVDGIGGDAVTPAPTDEDALSDRRASQSARSEHWTPLEGVQIRFSDGSVKAWLQRFDSLRETIAARYRPDQVTVAAAVHSVRAVPEGALAEVAAGLPAELPLHIHLSEQVAENEACLRATGLTPTALLGKYSLLTERLSAVHASHLSREDIDLLGSAGATVIMCPSTEADLADGIGPARALRDAGARLALGTDQHVAVDPWLEMRMLEYGERLASGTRGCFSPTELIRAASSGARTAMGTPVAVIAPGYACDLMAVDPGTVRTVGSRPDQLALTATGTDIVSVIVGGELLVHRGHHLRLGDPASLLASALKEFE